MRDCSNWIVIHTGLGMCGFATACRLHKIQGVLWGA